MVTGGGAPAAISALTSSAKRKTRWTIMVFMAAETVEGFAPLDDEAEKDLAELMKVQGVPGFRDFVDVFVQLHRDTGARRIHIGHSDEPIQNVDLKRAKGQPLTEFVRWARGQAPPGRSWLTALLMPSTSKSLRMSSKACGSTTRRCSTSLVSTRATSQAWKWQSNSNRSRTTFWLPKWAYHFPDGRTIESWNDSPIH
jgi:hypothetical protein